MTESGQERKEATKMTYITIHDTDVIDVNCSKKRIILMALCIAIRKAGFIRSIFLFVRIISNCNTGTPPGIV